jgi:hypothetical protein
MDGLTCAMPTLILLSAITLQKALKENWNRAENFLVKISLYN